MGLSVSLSHALAGMNVTQQSLEILSRNVSNAGTPGYHTQSLTLVEQGGGGGSSVRADGVERAFMESLQAHYNQSVSDLGYAKTRSDFLARVEQVLGTPGDTGSLDTVYQEYENALRKLATSPDDYAARANVVTKAQALAETLNRGTVEVQGLRKETEAQISSHVLNLNRSLQSLADVNAELRNFGTDQTTRASLMDERDRLIAQVAEMVDVRTDFQQNGTVVLSTKSGFGLVDLGATKFEFSGKGGIDPSSKFNIVDSLNGVGTLTATTDSGLRFDAVEQGLVRGGTLGALIELRDTSLVDLQTQIDEVAAGIAQAASTVQTAGTVVAGPPDGFSIDLADMQPGNEFTVNHTVDGVTETVRVVRVDDATKLPMDITGPDGERVIGLDFSAGVGTAATALNTALGSAITVSNPAGTVLQIVDDGVAATSNINSLSSKITVAASQGSGLALSLFTDQGGADFTNSLDGTAQKIGFAGRITVNSAIVSDNTLLVKYSTAASLGESDRPDFLLSQLEELSFTSGSTSSSNSGSFRLRGTVEDMVGQLLNFQGSSIETSYAVTENEMQGLESVELRMESEYGVNIDEEMARLMELQTAYAASARVVSVVQELIDALLRI